MMWPGMFPPHAGPPPPHHGAPPPQGAAPPTQQTPQQGTDQAQGVHLSHKMTVSTYIVDPTLGAATSDGLTANGAPPPAAAMPTGMFSPFMMPPPFPPPFFMPPNMGISVLWEYCKISIVAFL